MTKRQQFWVLVLGLPLAVLLILALAQAGMAAPSCGWKFPKWFGCVLYAHESLAGGLIGAAGALFAGWLAYSAVQEQISSSRIADIAAREAVRLQLKDLFETLNQVWRAIDLALQGDLKDKRRRSLLVKATIVLDALPNKNPLHDIDLQQLNPLDQVHFKRVSSALDWFYGGWDELRKLRENSNEQEPQLMKLRTLRIHLSHFEKFLRDFDPSMASSFEGRTLTKVDHRSMGEHIKPFVDEMAE